MAEEAKRKWRLEDLARFFKNSLMAIVKGQFILRLKLDKYFLQIVWTFFLFAMLILFSLKVDETLVEVETNKQELQELHILRTQKQYELIKLCRRSTVAESLKSNSSNVQEPEKPATTVR